jgi:hypothetical protein
MSVVILIIHVASVVSWDLGRVVRFRFFWPTSHVAGLNRICHHQVYGNMISTVDNYILSVSDLEHPT